ncbi:MAG: TonB-dependent receptor [Bryobacterales bacterium]|nr:TonB-dependent receptor [Bryobacterales bacterium]
MRALRSLFAITLFASLLAGQATEGTILGSIVDATGAAISNAPVRITNIGTGAIRSTTTNELGEYTVTNLPLGDYSVSAELSGFKKAVHPPVPITVKARVRVDLRLEVGETSQSVEVTGATPLIKTDTAEVGGVVSRQILQDVPVFGRNFLALAALVPGTTSGPPASRQRDFSGASINVGGASAEANNFIIDGISNNMEFSGAMGVVPAIDAIQEFAIQTSQYSAEFGRSGGGIVNLAIKSGSNEWHGFGYDYFRNDKLDARPFDFTFTNQPKQPLRRNQFGGGMGLPIIKNRMFLFGNYEGIRNPSATINSYIMPDATERRGDFSTSSIIYADPATTRPDPSNALGIRTPFPDNKVPSGRVDPMTTRMLGFFPLPNFRDPNPNVRNNYLVSEKNNDRLDSFNLKGDGHINETNTVTGRISQQRGGRRRSFWMPDDRLGGIASLDATNTGLTYTHVFKPTLVNEARAGYNYLRFGNEMLNTENVMDEFKIPGWNTVSFARGFPAYSVRNYTATSIIRPIASVPTPFFLVEHSWQFMDNLSWQRGRHAVKFGAEAGRIANNRFQGRNGGGALTYDGTYSTPRVGAALEALRSGMTDALLNQARAFSTNYQFDGVRIRSNRASWFVQDDFRVNARLTLNLGVRWEYFSPWCEEQDRLLNFDLRTGERLLAESTRPIIRDLIGIPNGNMPAGWRYTTNDQILPRPNWRNFSPRFGFAYNAGRNLVFRGGYGIFYAATVSNNFNNAGTDGSPFFFDFALASELDKPILPRDGFPAGGAGGAFAARTFSAYYGPLDRPDPYTQKWNFNIQWNPIRRTAIELGYSGQRALRFSTLSYGNSPLPGPGAVQDRRPYPNVGSFLSYLPVNDSNYNGLEITVKQQEFKGLSFLSAFTFSKSLAYTTGTDGGVLNDPYNFRYDYGLANYDFRKRWVSAVTYKPRYGQNWNKLVRAAVVGWETSSLLTLQGGFPFTVGVSGPQLNNGAGSNRANLVGNWDLGGQATRDRWFDTSVFTAPPNYVWGAQGKNLLRTPGLAQLDFSFQKTFTITEGKRLTLRMESQNFLNRVQLGAPAATLGAPNFGAIRSLQAGPRNIQLVGRFDF